MSWGRSATSYILAPRCIVRRKWGITRSKSSFPLLIFAKLLIQLQQNDRNTCSVRNSSLRCKCNSCNVQKYVLFSNYARRRDGYIQNCQWCSAEWSSAPFLFIMVLNYAINTTVSRVNKGIWNKQTIPMTSNPMTFHPVTSQFRHLRLVTS